MRIINARTGEEMDVSEYLRKDPNRLHLDSDPASQKSRKETLEMEKLKLEVRNLRLKNRLLGRQVRK